jgi:septum formation protein
MELILASTSPYRRALLERLGVPFRCRRPLIDEEVIKRENLPPQALAERLAVVKALSLRDAESEATIIGGDQVAVCAGQIFGKPGTLRLAEEQLRRLAGKSHQLITAVAVAHRGQVLTHTDITTLRMRQLSPSEIECYVAADRPVDCAGSYKIEERGIALFEAIDTHDPSAITGLPLIALAQILREFGYVIP